MMVPPEARDLFTAAHWNDRVLTTVPAPERVVDEVTARTRLLLAREAPLVTWARLEIDGSIPAAVRARLPLELSGCHSVLDILEREGGAAWWREHGRTFSGIFDLRDGSRSIAVLQAYTKTRGIRV